MLPEISIIRYKKDLRVADHKPLYEACQQGFPVVALYIREPSIMQAQDYSHFHQYRIQESIKDLKHSLSQLGIPLMMYHGEIKKTLTMIQEYYTIHHIYAYEETGNGISYQRDKAMIQYCKKTKIPFIEFPSNGVVRRLVYRDTRSNMHRQRMSQALVPIPEAQVPFELAPDLVIASKESFASFIPATKPTTRIHVHDIPGEQAGHRRLQYFLAHAGPYRYALSRPKESVMDSSRLSGYLTYGNLSMKQVHQATLLRIHTLKELDKVKHSKEIVSLSMFYQRLFWRCHFVQKLESRPSIEHYNQNREFDNVRTTIRPDYIDARYHGSTGVPLIDAGMRCLQATGWINFRMRATLVSFICDTCMQPRQAIDHMLARIFLDYEPGLHLSQLQMQSGTTGINTIRIYNPIKQLADKDSDLAFVRRWVPELADLSKEEILLLGTPEGSEILNNKNHIYPRPIIDVIEANREARVILWGIMKQDDTRTQAKRVYEKLGSRKKSTSSKKKKPIITQDSLFGDI